MSKSDKSSKSTSIDSAHIDPSRHVLYRNEKWMVVWLALVTAVLGFFLLRETGKFDIFDFIKRKYRGY